MERRISPHLAIEWSDPIWSRSLTGWSWSPYVSSLPKRLQVIFQSPALALTLREDFMTAPDAAELLWAVLFFCMYRTLFVISWNFHVSVKTLPTLVSTLMAEAAASSLHCLPQPYDIRHITAQCYYKIRSSFWRRRTCLPVMGQFELLGLLLVGIDQ